MGAIKNSYDVSLELSPWTDGSKFRIVRLQMKEQLGGELVKGEVELFSDGSQDALRMVTGTRGGTIKLVNEKDTGFSYTVPVSVTYREYFGNTLKFKFLGLTNTEFCTLRRNRWWKENIAGVIDATWASTEDPKDIRIPKGGIDDKVWYYQQCETDYEVNRKMCLAYSTDCIFAYGFGGLLIKDRWGRVDHEGNIETPIPPLKLESNRLTLHSSTYNLMSSEDIHHRPFESWVGHKEVEDCTTSEDYREVESENVRVMMDYKKYTGVNPRYTGHQYNYWTNKKFLDFAGYSFFEGITPDIPSYRLGDVLEYQRVEQLTQNESLPFKYYLVFSNEVFYTIDATPETDKKGLKFSWTTYFYGVESGSWV